MLLRTGLHPLIEHYTPDVPIALVEWIHRRLSQIALASVVLIRGRRAQTALSLPYKEGRRTGPGDTEIHLPGNGAMGRVDIYIL